MPGKIVLASVLYVASVGSQINPATEIPIGWALAGIIGTAGLVYWAATDRRQIIDRLDTIEKAIVNLEQAYKAK